MLLLQERDSCLVAVSGDGTLSVTDLRTLKVNPSLPFLTRCMHDLARNIPGNSKAVFLELCEA